MLKRNGALHQTIVHLTCLSWILTGCTARQVPVFDPQPGAHCDVIIVRQIEYGPKGLPMLVDRLTERPGNAGDHFTLVQIVNDHFLKSYDIVVAGSESDFTKPFKAVYGWTGRGFEAGARYTMVTTDIALRSGGGHIRDENAVLLAFAVAPLVIGTAGGFVFGVAAGVRSTAEEVGKVIIGNKERLVTYTAYEYDALGRLAFAHMYKGDESKQELVRTEYEYEMDSRTPLKTRITTLPDGTVRVVE